MTSEDFEIAFRQLGGGLVVYITNAGLDPTLAKDIAQDTWLQAWRHREKFRGDSKFSSWLFAIAKNEIIGHFRKRRIEQLPAGYDVEHHPDFQSGILANQILRRMQNSNSDLLRRYYVEEEFATPIPAKIRLQALRACKKARECI